LTDEENLVQEIAEHIIFSHATDIENLTVWEMTADHIRYTDDLALQMAYENEEDYERLTEAVHAKVDSAIIGISWDGGDTWQW
jgi:hypothetical protein